MSRITDFFRSIVQPTANNSNEPLTNLNGSLTAPSFIPSGNTTTAWTNGISHNLTDGSDEQRGLTKEYSGGKVNVPVYNSDTQWDVVKRSLGMFADQANLSGEAKQAFVQKWTAELERTGQTAIYRNNTGEANSADAFAAKINTQNANQAAGVRGSFEMTISSGVQPEMIGDLRALRSSELSTARIKDPQLRNEVKADLRQIIAGTGAEKTAAAQTLLNRAAQGEPEADAVYQATKATANRDDQRLNAALKMAELRIDAAKQQELIGPIDAGQNKAALAARIKEAVRLAEKSDLPANTSASGKADRAEAAWVNQQAAILTAQTGDKKEAVLYEMAGRYYEVTEDERASIKYPFETSLPRWKEPADGGDSMRALTTEEQALHKFKKENPISGNYKKDLGEDPQKRKLDGKGKVELDEKGNLKKQPEIEFDKEGSLKETGRVSITTYQYYNDKGQEVGRGKQHLYKKPQTTNIPFEGSELRPRGIIGSTNVAAGVGAIEEVNKWGTFLGDYYNHTSLKKYQERVRLEEAAFTATRYPVPPMPEELPKFKAQLEQQFGKEKAAPMMQKLEEFSHAFWNR